MKISKIETFTYWIEWCNWLFVKVSTDEGLHGWGEGSLHGAVRSVETAIQELGAALIGQDPAGVERHWQALYHAWRWRGGATLSTALAALDIALWDIEGKRLGVPIYRLLGGPFRPRLRAYASHWLAGAQTPEAAFEGAREAVRRGFTAFKWTAFDRERLLSRWEFRELLESGGCKVIQPDLMHAAGITEVRKIAALADTYYIPVAPHNPGGPICMLAAMHLAAAIPNFLILEQMEDERPLRDQLCTEPVRYADGSFALPTGPG